MSPNTSVESSAVLPPVLMTVRQKLLIALYFAALTLLLILGIIAVGWGMSLVDEVRLVLIVVLAGGIGGLVQSTSSFISFAGERKLYTSWGWWYVLRPLIGAGLALVFYFAVRGGLVILTSSNLADAASINPFAVGALGGLVGMFSKEATDKLKEIAESIFKKQERIDPPTRPESTPPTDADETKK